MGKFVAYIKQQGEGCDYTIACGYKLINLKAASYVAALQELTNIIKENYSEDDYRLSSVTLIEVANKWKIDVDKIYLNMESEIESNEIENKNIRDYAEYQRLKRQFGDVS